MDFVWVSNDRTLQRYQTRCRSLSAQHYIRWEKTKRLGITLTRPRLFLRK
jgi:hypothetical protein